MLSLDVKRAAGTASGFVVTTHGGRTETGIDALDWAERAIELGAGELLVNSIDADGTKEGFDLELIRRDACDQQGAGHRLGRRRVPCPTSSPRSTRVPTRCWRRACSTRAR